MAQTWNEYEVFRRLKYAFTEPAHLLLPQVRNGTGYARKLRTADALVVSVWPSRGLWMAGVEIKVSKSDYLRELKQPTKSQAIQQYCKYWWVAAPQGIVDAGKLPETWGAIEVAATSARVVKPAPALECLPPDLSFLCAVLRSVEENTVSKDAVANMVAEQSEKAAANALQRSRSDYEELKRTVDAFQEASGVDIGQPWTAPAIGAAVKLLRDTNVAQMTNTVRRIADEGRHLAQSLTEAIARFEAQSKGVA